MAASRLSVNRKTTRNQVGGYDIIKWNDIDLNEDSIVIESHADNIDLLDTSVNILYTLGIIQDVSILSNFTKTNIIDSSVNILKNYDSIQDASILIAIGATVSNYDKTQDSSIIINEINIAQLDTSIIRLDNYIIIQDASITQSFSDIFDVSARILINENDISIFDAYSDIQDVSILGNVIRSGDSMSGDLSINAWLYTQAIQYDTSIIDPVSETAGLTWWNKNELALNIATGIGPVLQVGQEIYILIYNDTGAQIDNATILRPKAATLFNGQIVPTVEKAKADVFSTIEGTIMAATMDIPNNSIGLATRFGRVRGSDTTNLTPGADAYVSDTSAGTITNTRPTFPSYAIKIGATLNSSTNGESIISVSTTITDTFNNFYNGTFREPFKFDVSSNGTQIIGTLSPDGTNIDQTLIFSDGFTLFPDASIIIIPGTDTNPQLNYIYIPQSTKTLTVSTSAWPTGIEHVKVGTVFVQSASEVFASDVLTLFQWNDPIEDLTQQGHLSHITQKIRQFPAQWQSGVEGSVFIETLATPDDVYFSNTNGVVFQLHTQTFPALDMSTGDHIHVINHPTTPYFKTLNLNTQLNDSLGVTLNSTSFSFVIWGVVNSNGSEDQLMLNLPSGSYAFTSPVDAVNDVLNYANYNIPYEFLGTGFLIARFTFTYKNDDWVLFDTEDLRGKIPNTTAGGGSGGSGVTSFTGLADTPSDYTGNALNLVQVNSGESALEFVPAAGGGVSQAYVDSSLAQRDISLNYLYDYNTIQDASIALGGGSDPVHITYADTSTMVTAQGNQLTNYLYYSTETESTFRYLGTTTTVLKTDYDIISGRPLQIVYPSDTSLFADQVNQWNGYFYYDSSSLMYLEYLGTTNGNITDYRGKGVIQETVVFSLSDYITNISAGTGKAYWLSPWDCSIVNTIGALLVTDPSGANAIFDLNKNGITMMTTNKITIEDGETSSITATTQPVFTTIDVSKGDIISADIDQAGSAVGGVGASITLILTRS